MTTTRTIQREGNHIDIETLIDGVWAVTFCNQTLTTKEDEMTNKNQQAIETLYESRGDLMEDFAIASINERPFYLQPQLNDVIDQIKLIEHITPEAQRIDKALSELFDIDPRSISQQELDAMAEDWKAQQKELRGG